jgi:hypothetical protein
MGEFTEACKAAQDQDNKDAKIKRLCAALETIARGLSPRERSRDQMLLDISLCYGAATTALKE